jgi:hypothetical protein
MQRSLLLVVLLLLSACSSGDLPVVSTEEGVKISTEWTQPGPQDALLVGAGDIARCDRRRNAKLTGDLIRALLGSFPEARVFTAGDNAYQDGTAAQFASCYEPAWGSFNDRTLPAPGNHDYHVRGARPYFDYFDHYRQDPAARQRGYYSVDLRDWHVVSLNSAVPMDAASPQAAWLEADLRSTKKACTLAIWHHPLFSSGWHGGQSGDPGRRAGALWTVLERHHADVIVNGHDHHYERFALQDHTGKATDDGIREFVVGTGGAELRTLKTRRANSQERDDTRHGVLVLTLQPNSYTWAFLGIDGEIHDRSTAPVRCHVKGN